MTLASPPTATAERRRRRAWRAGLALGGALLASPVANAERLTLTGVNGALRDNILAFLVLDELDCDAPLREVERRTRDADERIENALAALGHYEPQIDKREAHTDACWSVTIDVEPGPQMRYQAFTVRINGEAESDERVGSVARAAPTAGDAVHHGRYEAYKSRLGQMLSSRGYLDWQFVVAELVVDVDRAAAIGVLAINSGPRYDFGEIRVEQSALDPGLVERFIDIEAGEPFDRQRMTALQRALSASSLFDEVLVAADYEGIEERSVPIRVRLSPTEKLGYYVGVGASTDRGPRLSGGYRNGLVNPRGHQFNGDFQVSPVLTRAEARYRLPLADPRVEWQSYQARIEDESTETSDSQSVELGVERIRSLPRDWVLTYGLQLSRIDFEVSDVSDTTTLTMPIVGLSRREADSETNPRRGSSLEVRLRGASSSLASTTDFLQLYARYRRLYAIGANGRLSLRGEVGTTWRNDFDELPPRIRFFAGGDASVRGYGFQRVGPRNDAGDVIGGRSLLTASVEYEHTVRGNWGVAVFADAGNAFDGSNIDPVTGVGLGVVWRSPVGPVRAYLAHPLDADRLVRVHLTFGADL